MSRWQLTVQGFVTAVANPKGWAFFIVLLPPFIDGDLAMAPQLTILVGVILLIEFLCLVLYAKGGPRSAAFCRTPGRCARLIAWQAL